MKELSIEEKAKAYDKALKKAQEAANNGYVSQNFVSDIFPELKESEDEDERIRKEMLQIAKESEDSFYMVMTPDKRKHLIAWLEKKGEQNLVKIPKFKSGDTIEFNGLGHNRYTIKEVCGTTQYINSNGGRMDMSYTDANFKLVEQKSAEFGEKLIADVFEMVGLAKIVRQQGNDALTEALQSAMIELAKYSVVPQPKNEWSEEDESRMENLCHFLKEYGNQYYGALTLEGTINWLKSLRPQFAWKPSEAQMVALNCAITAASDNLVCLNIKDLESLYEQLKKLKQ